MRRFLCLPLLALLHAAGPPHPVIDAVHEGHAVGHEQQGIDAVRAALKSGAPVDGRDEAGWTPLMYAALECRAKILDVLLESGAAAAARGHAGDPSLFLESGQTPPTVAAGCFIARRRAQLAPERHMPPDYAAYELAAAGSMVRSLVAHGAPVNQPDALGRTPLMLAAMHGWPAAVRALLAAHAAVNARDREGRLAIDYVDPADSDIVRLLTRAGSHRPTGHSGRTVCDAQKALGDDIVDCIAGRQMADELRKFQQGRGLPASGVLDPPTRAALKIR